MKRTLSLIILMLTLCITVNATDYYCSPTGNGDGSSREKAGSFTTLVKNLKAGDVLYCLGGQYNYSSGVSIGVSGTKDKYIKIWAAEGEKPILDFRKQAYKSTGVNVSGSYVHMKGLTIRYTGKNGLLNSGSYTIFEHLDVYGCGDTGVQMKGGHNNLILNCDSHDNFDYRLSDGTTAIDYGGNADGFADKQYEGGGNTYRGCRAWRNSDDGWDFYQHRTGTYGPTVIDSCICYANGPGEYDMRNHPRYETDKNWFDQFVTEITVTDKRGNKHTCSLEHYINMGNANGFKLGGDYTTHNVNLTNSLSLYNGNTFNLSADLGAKGIDQNNNAGTMNVYNCTSFGNPRNIGFDQVKCGTVNLYNNISYKGVNEDAIICQNHIEKNNSWNIEGLNINDADFLSVDSTGIMAPRNADGSLPYTAFMHLSKNSQLIDLGTTETGMEYYGVAPDLGCYETTEGGKQIPPTLSVNGPKTQTVKAGRAIQTVTVTAGGSATAISAIGDTSISGVNVAVDGLKAIISGTPDIPGTYTITLTPVTEQSNTLSTTITINVNEATASTIAYVSNGTDGSNAADAKIIEAIAKVNDIKFFDANSSNNDYSDCDAIIISPVPSSGATAMNGLKNYNLPTLLLKPFMMKSSVWNWGSAVNTSDLEVTITDATHDIFKNINITGNKLKLFTTKSGDGAVTAISTATNWSSAKTLAAPVSASNNISIADLTNATLNGTQIKNRYVMIGISEYSTANLTEVAQQLISNACYYIMGKEIPTPSAIRNVTAETNMTTYYDLQGRITTNPSKGLYISNGRKVIR